jgi:type I restriction enzyme S subunit
MNLLMLRANPSVLFPPFATYFFETSAFLMQIKKITKKSVNQASFTVTSLKEIEIPLPPLDEQRRIAAVLDKVSGLIAKRRQQLDKLDEMVKARFAEMFGDPVENPMGWDKISLGKRCDIVAGNTPSRAEPENYGNFIEWIKSDNINTPAVLLTEAQEYLSEIGFHKCRFVEAGSLLMTCIAGSINCIGNVAVTDHRVAFNQQINAIVPKQDDVLYLYWLMLLSKPAIHSTINMALKGILSKGQLSEMVFPFPPIQQQNQFSAFAKQTEKTKANISSSLKKLETLKKALMQEYFG